jgi:molecular chaperone GrpE
VPAGDAAGRPDGAPAADALTQASAPDSPYEAPASDAADADGPVDASTPPSEEVDRGAEDAEPIDHERRVDLDLAELEAKAEKADEYLELARRTRADFDNFRKRAAREAQVAQERGVAKLAKELLPAVDNLDRALAAAEQAGEGADETLATGVKLVHAELLGALARAGIEPFSPQGELFDPQRHEAIAQMPVEGAPAGTIVEVYQRGYLLGETVLRPARVVVAG